MSEQKSQFERDRQRLIECYRGDVSAAQLALDLAFVSNVWDDLIDRDNAVSPETINKAFWAALISIPGNSFYVKNQRELNTLFTLSVINWQVANKLQASKEERAVEIAHVLRYSLADVLVYMAGLVGGRDWAVEVGPEIRLMCQRDTLKNFIDEVAHA